MDYNFADDLKAIREILGYTQFEIAEQIGVEQVTILLILSSEDEVKR